jgi:hypothetical protein
MITLSYHQEVEKLDGEGESCTFFGNEYFKELHIEILQTR